MQRPLIGISSGDPAGIGPEITAKALSSEEVYRDCRPLVVSDLGIMEHIIDRCNIDLGVNRIEDPSEGMYQFGTIDVLDLANVRAGEFQFNKISEMCGKASYEYVEKVIMLALENKIDATVTGPIHKEAIKLAGYDYAGHTEIYAELTNTEDYAMMLADRNFRVVHVSTHVSLSEAIRRVKKARIVKVTELAHNALKSVGLEEPRIAVAGLNPHAGEHGLFGDEEIDEIIPAVEEARTLGYNASGPFPPDTIFPKMKGGQYDVVVCMYHDQGHIPTKLLSFDYDSKKGEWEGLSGVNITLGLPIIRVSVDHGVAFDIGGKGVANEESMLNAIQYATELYR